MKFLMSIGIIIIAVAPLICARPSDKDLSNSLESKEKTCCNETVPNNKVKLTKIKLLTVNREYYGECYIAEVIEVNKTYNRLLQDFEIKKDFPLNVEWKVELFRSNLNSDKYQKIGVYTIPLCSPKPSKYDAYVSAAVLELRKSGKCFEKGTHFSFPDSGFFKFDELLSNEELKNAKFILVRYFVSDCEVILQDELYFSSNIH